MADSRIVLRGGPLDGWWQPYRCEDLSVRVRFTVITLGKGAPAVAKPGGRYVITEVANAIAMADWDELAGA